MAAIIDRKYIIDRIRGGDIRYAQDIDCVSDYEIVYELLKQNGSLMQQIDKMNTGILWGDTGLDRDLVLAAVKSNGYALNDIIVLEGRDNLIRDKEILMTALHNQPEAIRFVPQDLRDDPYIIEAIQQAGNEDFVTTPDEKVRKTIQKINEGHIFSYMEDEFYYTNPHIVKAILKQDGTRLYELAQKSNSALFTPGLKLDRDLVLTAVKSNGRAYLQLKLMEAEDLIKDKEIALEAIKSWPNVISDVPEELKNDPDIKIAIEAANNKIEEKRKSKMAEAKDAREENHDEALKAEIEKFEKGEIKLDQLNKNTIANGWSFGRVIDIVKQRVIKFFTKATEGIKEDEQVDPAFKAKIGEIIANFESKIQGLRLEENSSISENTNKG